MEGDREKRRKEIGLIGRDGPDTKMGSGEEEEGEETTRYRK